MIHRSCVTQDQSIIGLDLFVLRGAASTAFAAWSTDHGSADEYGNAMHYFSPCSTATITPQCV